MLNGSCSSCLYSCSCTLPKLEKESANKDCMLDILFSQLKLVKQLAWKLNYHILVLFEIFFFCLF